MDSDFTSQFEDALVADRLAQLSGELAAAGLSQVELYDRAFRFRLQLLAADRDAEAARLAALLDRIVGWCAPEERLFPTALNLAEVSAYYEQEQPQAGEGGFDPAELLALYDHQVRQGDVYPDMTRQVLAHQVTRFSRPAPGRSFILYSQLDEDSADAAIAEQAAYFQGLGQTFEWKVYGHDRPADLVERLRQRGFAVDEPEAVLGLDLEQAPAALLAPPLADVRAITHPRQLSDIVQVERQVWGGTFDWMPARLGAHLQIPDYLSAYVAYAEGQPACAAWVYFRPGTQIGELYGGSTLPAFRRRGLYTALLQVRVQEALRGGLRYLVVDASPESRPILEKHGFRLLTYATACTLESSPPM